MRERQTWSQKPCGELGTESFQIYGPATIMLITISGYQCFVGYLAGSGVVSVLSLPSDPVRRLTSSPRVGRMALTVGSLEKLEGSVQTKLFTLVR